MHHDQAVVLVLDKHVTAPQPAPALRVRKACTAGAGFGYSPVPAPVGFGNPASWGLLLLIG